MVFWLAVAVGGIFAWVAVQIGFYATWILFFHLVLSAYVAIFLTPVIIANVPAATTTDYGYALILMSVAVATLCIAYGICFACLTGHLRVEFPKIFDSLFAGLLGFQAGFLVLSFLTFTFCLTPLSKADFCKTFGLDAQSQKSNIAFMCWWCDRVHGFVSCPGPQPNSKKEVERLVHAATPAAEEPGVDAEGGPGKTVALPPPSVVVHKVEPEASPPVVKANEKAEASPGEHSPEHQSEAAPPGPTSVAGVQPSRPSGESLEQELARRRVVIHTPEDLEAAVAKQEVRIIEVADACTVDKLDSKRVELLQRWVSEGGILWVNNDILTLFGVQHSRLASWGGELYCRVSGKAEVSSILADCKKVRAKGRRRQSARPGLPRRHAVARPGDRHPLEAPRGNNLLVVGALWQGVDQRSEIGRHDAVRRRAILA